MVEFKYSDPADPAKMTNSERVSTRFEATWTDANGIPDRRRFEILLDDEMRRPWKAKVLKQ